MSFTVLMSLYSKEKHYYLDECLSSLYNQTLKPDEIVIVFDGPIDSDLEGIVLKWMEYINIKCVRLSENVGLGKALNYGLEFCTNSIVARMDTDDICEINRFELQFSEFIKDHDLSICGSYITEFTDENREGVCVRKVPLDHSDIYKNCCKANPFNHMTVMFRKDVIKRAGGYQHFPWMEDWALWLHLLSEKDCKAKNIPLSLVKARAGEGLLARRSGFKYIYSELKIAKLKIDLGLCNRFTSIFLFIIRSIPRLLPKSLLSTLYRLNRGNL